MDEPIAAGDVLASPTRARLFALLQELRRPAPTEELAERLGLHVNGVRRQLERLSEAGLVARRRARQARGRPRDEWSIAVDADPGGERPRGYAELASWLSRAIPPSPGRLREVERTGREIGRELAPADGEPSTEGFATVLTALGFRPRLEPGGDGELRCTLCNCPYRESVRVNAEVVCTLHRGITAGLLDRMAPGARLRRFEPKDPETAGCVAVIDGTGWALEPQT